MKFSRRANVYTTMLACASGLWLLSYRFGLSWQQIKEFFFISLGLLVLLLAIALPAGFLLWLVNSLRNK